MGPDGTNARIPEDTIALVRELARLMPDRQIARLLNRAGVETGHGKRKSACAASAITTTSPSSATASGRSAAKLRSKRQQNSSASATWRPCVCSAAATSKADKLARARLG